MSNLSIFKTTWDDLVFEGRNKEYGAYELRRENPKTTLLALLTALFLVAFAVSVPTLLHHYLGKSVPQTKPEIFTLTPVTYFPPAPKPLKEKAILPATNKGQRTKPEMTHPVVAKPSEATVNVPANVDIPTGPSNPTGTDSGTATITTSGGGDTETLPATPTPSGPLNSYELDKNPEFPGGIKAFLTYVGHNFKTPDVELDSSVKVYVSFVVETDGTLTDIAVRRDPGYGLGDEAIRVLKTLKAKWKPGMKDGKPVRAYYNLPISVELK